MNSLFIFILVLLINFLTLSLVTLKSKRSVKILFTNPAFLIGDLFLIPLYGVLVTSLLNRNLEILGQVSNLVFVFIVVLATFVTLGFGVKFKLMKFIWVPHGVIAWLIILSLLVSFYLLLFPEIKEAYLLIAAVLILLVHQLLGTIFPKIL